MYLINSISNDPKQQFNLTGIPGIQVSVLLTFMPRIATWNMDITYGSINLQGIPVRCSPNMLRQWRNVLPFGMACVDIYKIDPYTVNDFALGAASLFLLDSEEVAAVEAGFFS